MCNDLERIGRKPPSGKTARAARRLRRNTDHFVRDEDGSLSILSIFTVLMVIAVGGLGVDFMIAEYKRTNMQNTLDRAVLAAADLEQVLDPSVVVVDYFDKMNMSDTLTNVDADTGLNYKDVTGTAESNDPANFTSLVGLDSIKTSSLSRAIERIANVEISLVLDISGSMASNNKMANLQTAANTFIDTVLEDDNEDLISISLVPYSEHVNAGPDLAQHFNVNWRHGYSHCLEIDANQFDSTELDMNRYYEQAQHFQWNYAGWNARDDTICPRYSYERIRPLTQDGNALKWQIGQFQPRAGTSIFLGMKWATALLSPGHRPLVNEMISDGDVSGTFSGRPANWNDEETLKTIVLMTDGQHDRSYRLQDWAYDSSSEVSHWNSYNLWYYLQRNVNRYYHSSFYWQKYNADMGDQLLDRICDAAKAKGIVIWSIGFEVEDHGADVMQQCASSPAHFYRVEGIEIENAFYSIARAINQLRLVQ
ncbi:von Willebrand factor type A domain protein [Roseivivax jejudonensis]|uniref:von Willebrand factor type A domain protein n=1 Tax=Roseivivax jejudonensis TaxID=1529041 RepID=A0A1X7A9S8_9RHOB|nr:TadE/TadG family type IV pilus assembly protein [Roseivivax jejudonensis]SLN73714.1 von Willebrand factor type A domain protein [Roseivivax jejudonensis]